MQKEVNTVKVRADGMSDIKRVADEYKVDSRDVIKYVIEGSNITVSAGRRSNKTDRQLLSYYMYKFIENAITEELREGTYYYIFSVSDNRRFFTLISEEETEAYLLHSDYLDSEYLGVA